MIAIAVAAVVATAGLVVPVTAASAAPSVERIAGPDRYATAVAISKSAFTTAPVVYVATGESFPDALSAAPAAAKQNGPLLLTQTKSLPAAVKNEIARLKPKSIVVVGGTGVISAAVEAQLGKLATTKRIGGTDRYDTSRRITSHAFPSSTTAYIATGRDYPDALSASGAAGSASAPVVLVDGKSGSAGSATTALLKKLGVKTTIIAGGTGVVSAGVQESLTPYGVSRQSGSDRYQTSEKLNKSTAKKASHAYLATGTAFPDALAGAAIAGAKSKPLYVVPTNCVPAGTKADISGSSVTLLGGTGALGSGVAKLTSCSPANPGTTKPAPPATEPPVVAPPAQSTRPNSKERPFAVPGPNTSSKKVFAHYFPPYPISMDNKQPDSDYYTVNYLNPNGEKGIHAAYGGLLRDRPVKQAPVSGDWKALNLKKEVQQAADAGIDGFTVDIMSLTGMNWEATVGLMDAAAKSGRNFTVVPNIDVTASAGKATPAEVAKKLAELYKYSSAHKLPTGEYLLSSFKAEGQTVAWWSSVINTLSSTYKVKTKFIAVFLNASDANMKSFAPISYAFSNWGVRTPTTVRSTPNYVAKAAAYGKKWMEPVAVQDARPRNSMYAESNNTETLREMWKSAISKNADFVQMVTWNDYSESTSFAPSEAHGGAFLDMNAFYAAQYKTGNATKITGDVVYVSHRTHPHAARPSHGNQVMKPTLSGTSTSPRDTVEVMTMLTAPATVSAVIGGKSYTANAPAGISTVTFPLATGTVAADVIRSGVKIASVKSPHKVVSNPTVLDLQYFAASSREG
ncbi:endo-1,3-alpha-glucanase family glycosylhydrolase [Homoserinimonas sp. OAct 916]|uniref:endo-1,3-alpha-glucanase family glycosylhydrolase n=1 Tax=Homoserinimonas sp. OAct 916 TaxID=2211450 RepID=UPI000DBE657F|nr:endo-1,3-alpha-glucanase family glycosylhydrolase [Homoserinimonas sp. OAct 916]